MVLVGKAVESSVGKRWVVLSRVVTICLVCAVCEVAARGVTNGMSTSGHKTCAERWFGTDYVYYVYFSIWNIPQ